MKRWDGCGSKGRELYDQYSGQVEGRDVSYVTNIRVKWKEGVMSYMAYIPAKWKEGVVSYVTNIQVKWKEEFVRCMTNIPIKIV
jgi:hypothetical protein